MKSRPDIYSYLRFRLNNKNNQHKKIEIYFVSFYDNDISLLNVAAAFLRLR
jgi:hypothetical protein